MSKLQFGVLSTAKIARKDVIPAIRQSKTCEISAIASRSRAKAEKTASTYSIEKAYEGYEALLADADIDAVYIPLPNHLHLEYIKKSVQAGKHVLCEKPLTMNADETAELIAFMKDYPDIVVMEAFMYRYHSQWKLVKKLVEGGRIGKLNAVQSVFTYFNDNPEDIRNKPETGGGGLLDIGCYCISLSRTLFNAEPDSIHGYADVDDMFGVDRLAGGVMQFGDGVATFVCGTQTSPQQYATILGSRGSIHLERPFSAAPDGTSKVLVRDNYGKTEELTIEPGNHYRHMFEAFVEAVETGDRSSLVSLEDSLNNMKVIDTIRL